MRNTLVTQNSPEEDARSSLVVDENSIFYHPFNFLAKEYGNDPEKLLKRLSVFMGAGVAGNFIKNKKLKTTIRFLQYGITAGLLGADFAMHVKSYIRSIKQAKADPYKKRMVKACKILGIAENSPLFGDIPHTPFDISPEIAIWIAQQPKTTRIKIKGYYNMQSMEELERTPDFDVGKFVEVAILFEMEKDLFMWDISFQTSLLGTTHITSSFLLGKTIHNEKADEIRKALLYDFAQTLDTCKNVIKFDGWGGLVSSPRRHVSEKLNQFDVDRFIAEIIWVLKHGGKRTYAFVGKQGTGKSSILRVLEERLTEYMIIHLHPEDFEYASRVRDRFDVAKMFQPVIVIIEDMDACGMRNKNKVTGAFLECIDEVNKDLNMIIVYTVNDTSLVHRTIINRPGRSDRVIEIYPPKSAQEALEVIMARLEAVKGKYCKDFDISTDNMDVLLKVSEKCVKENFTQAEITNAVVEQSLIEIGLCEMDSFDFKGHITTETLAKYLNKAIETHLETRKAIKNCNFHNTDPDDDEDNYPCEEKVSARSSVYGEGGYHAIH